MSTLRALGFVVPFVVLVVACSSSSSNHPDAQTAKNQIAQSVCNKIQACLNQSDAGATSAADAGGDAGAMPFTVSSCVSTLTAGASSGQESCTQDQLNTCTDDVAKQDCSGFVTFLVTQSVSALPMSCQSC